MRLLNGKKWWKSTTIWAAILLVAFSVLQNIGVDPIIAYEILYSVAGALGLYGIRSAIDRLLSDGILPDKEE